MRQVTRWIGRPVWVCLVCVVSGICLGGIVHAVQPDNREQPEKPGEPVDWDLLPNGLLVVQYDSTGDGVPDSVALHQVTWSGWTAQPILEIEAQARQDDQWAFIVDDEQDRCLPRAADSPVGGREVSLPFWGNYDAHG
ncbi:MAG: hypothetical protein NNA20_12355 [Nitrospira sp.]|nr:hypothetical protein [Nitrospira sp.]